ncbi:MAG: iron-containing alcohol dehydrogenase, partial [Streptosporangiaceae bacterium]
MTVHSAVAGTEIAISPTPAAYLGSGAVAKLPGILGGTGSDAAVVVTDAGLAATRVVARVTSVLHAAGIPVTLFSGVQPNPTTADLAAGADAVAATGPARARV